MGIFAAGEEERFLKKRWKGGRVEGWKGGRVEKWKGEGEKWEFCDFSCHIWFRRNASTVAPDASPG
jgi:hypothetical protein